LLKEKLFLMVDVILWHTRKCTDSYFVMLERGNWIRFHYARIILRVG
jgi:hypothetical protein